ncbi:MAG: hypothetical protein ACKE9I_00065 [Methylophagaceae bacterium]
MYSTFKTIFLSAVAVVSTFLIVVFSFGFFMGTHTHYCPWGHLISDLAVCVVLDKNDSRTLIQHADLDINIYYLEIENEGISKKYEFPNFIAHISSGAYSAKLVTSSDEYILINDRIFYLKELSNDT